MKLRTTVLSAILALLLGGVVWNGSFAIAEENGSATTAQATTETQAVKVGNKNCPVSGEEVGGHGPVVEIEHNGKIYNLCCAMCKKDFLKDPDKYIQKIKDTEGLE